ncbi:MAG: diguanylate cyclase [Naasia sp.]|nr:diguanylate cyclase [Naasia sp.]
MTGVSIIGIGNMGAEIARIAAKGGSAVQLIVTAEGKGVDLANELQATVGVTGTTLTGDVVVLAVPYPAVEGILDTYADQLAGKTIVDITNPVDFSTFDALVVPADSSAAAQIAGRVPGAKVVKAFNTTFAATLATGSVGEAATTTVLVAGDDAAAKQQVIDLVQAGGLRAEDAGTLKRARELESLGFLQLGLAVGEKVAWTGGFAVTR